MECEKGEFLFNGYRVSFLQGENILEICCIIMYLTMVRMVNYMFVFLPHFKNLTNLFCIYLLTFYFYLFVISHNCVRWQELHGQFLLVLLGISYVTVFSWALQPEREIGLASVRWPSPPGSLFVWSLIIQ
jgi:hypothetical protein